MNAERGDPATDDEQDAERERQRAVADGGGPGPTAGAGRVPPRTGGGRLGRARRRRRLGGGAALPRGPLPPPVRGAPAAERRARVRVNDEKAPAPEPMSEG